MSAKCPFYVSGHFPKPKNHLRTYVRVLRVRVREKILKIKKISVILYLKQSIQKFNENNRVLLTKYLSWCIRLIPIYIQIDNILIIMSDIFLFIIPLILLKSIFWKIFHRRQHNEKSPSFFPWWPPLNHSPLLSQQILHRCPQ